MVIMENPIKMDDLEVPLFLETVIWLPFWNICQNPKAFDSVKHPEASHGGALLHIKAQDLKFLEAGGHGSDHHEGSMGTICV